MAVSAKKIGLWIFTALCIITNILFILVMLNTDVQQFVFSLIAAVKKAEVKPVEWGHSLSLLFIWLDTLYITVAAVYALLHYQKALIKEKEFTNSIYFTLIGVVLIIAFWMRFSFPLPPYGIADGYIALTFNYLGMGAMYLAVRSFYYPLVLLFFSSVFGNLVAVTLFQMLLGVGSGLLLLFLWNKTAGFYNKKSPLFLLLHKFAGVFLLAFYLFNVERIHYEHILNIEAFTTPVIVLILFIGYLVITKRNNIFYFALFIILNALLALMQSKWLFAGMFSVVAAVVYQFLHAENRKQYLFTGAALLVSCLLVGGIHLHFKKDIASPKEEKENFTYGTLFYAHYGIVIREVEKDYADPHFTKYDKTILQDLITYYHCNESLYFGKHHAFTTSSGFNEIYHRPPVYPIQTKIFKQLKSYEIYKYYFMKSAVKHPWLYCSKVLHELAGYYVPLINYAYAPNTEENFNGLYRKVETLLGEYNNSPLLEKYRIQVREVIANPPRNFSMEAFNLFYKVAALAYPVVLLLFLVVFIRNMVTKRAFVADNRFFILIGMILIQIFLALLLSSMVYLLIDRYIDEILPLTVMAEWMMAEYLLVHFMQRTKAQVDKKKLK